MHRRHRGTVVAALLTAVLLIAAGCSATARTEPAASAPASTGAAFPVTVEHQFGSTTIPSEPQRVVSVGLTEQDTLLQLGIVPIATTDWYGDQPYAVWPWARPLLGDAEPTVLTTDDGFQFEKIAELQPDLIIGVNAGMERADYDKLSKIAPTVTSITGARRYFSAWQDQTRQIATAVGKPAEGEKLIEQIKAGFATAAAAHPEFAGTSATFSQGAPWEGTLYVYPDGLSTSFLTDLGFTITPGLEKYQAKPDEQAQISAERVDAIDADVIVFATEDEKNFQALQDWSTISRLTAVRGNRAVYTDATLAGAIYFTTPLSLAYVLEHLTPQLALATKGQAPREYPAG